VNFTAPIALLLAIALPVVWWIGRPRLVTRRGRDSASLLLRTAIVVCLILALAGAQIVRSADRLAVVFLVDGSDSMGGAALAAQFEAIDTAIAGMATDDQAAVVVFGGDALIERPMSGARELAPFRSTPMRGASDIEEAISLGLALFPPGAARRMVLLSDGRQTSGDAEAAAARAAAIGVPISVIPYRADPAPDVRVTEFRAPSVVAAGQGFDLAIDIAADVPTSARIRVFASGAVIYDAARELQAGTNRYTVPLTAGETRGFGDFRVQVEPIGADGFYQNNQLAAFSRVVGPPRALLLSDDPRESDALANALIAVGIGVDSQVPGAAPIGVAALAGYDAVILNDVPASALAPARMTALQTYVRDLGGGLVVIGGGESYAPGGYFQTPIEETLPVEMRLRDQQRVPQITIAYVIDRSGSMMVSGASGVTNLELAQEAIIRSIDFLQPTDRAGVVSFDSEAFWVAEVQTISDRVGLQNLVASLRSGGGTDILAGYRLASESLIDETSQRKHIILLTDGGASDAGLIDLSKSLNADYGITTSVIAIGGGSPDFLAGMASAGGGNYHPVQIVESIPLIFSQETVLATRAYTVETIFTPDLTAISPIMNGIDALPALRGYVATSEKDTATVILRAPEPYPDPILASWQYGLGRAVAFTSDAAPRWAADWVTWDGFAQFWGQAARWTMAQGVDNALEARVVMEGDSARVVVDAREADGAFRNGLTLDTLLTQPDGESVRLALRQVAPGRYEAAFTPTDEGAYFVRAIASEGESGGALSPLSGWVMRYSAEYGQQGADVLPAIAAISGGEFVSDPESIYDRRALALDAQVPLAPILLLVALLLLPIDIAVRRLLVTRSDLARVQAALLPRRATAPSARMATLLDAKERAGTASADGAADNADIVPAVSDRWAGIVSGEGAAADNAGIIPASPALPTSVPAADGETLAGRLLQRRRDREG